MMNTIDKYYQARKSQQHGNKNSDATSVPAPILSSNTGSPRPQRPSVSGDPILWARDSKEGFVLVEVLKSEKHTFTGRVLIDGKRRGSMHVYGAPNLFKRCTFHRSEITDCCALQEANAANTWAHLRERYMKKIIYTNIGNILIAMNPFCQIEHLYSAATLRSYLKEYPKNNEPHVFRLAADVLKYLKTTKSRNIIITGESGAGKTRSAQHVMSVICSTQGCVDSIDKKIMNANIFLEAFGNAATRLNPNSSRYNKLIKVQYDGARQTLGGRMSHHLLETTRVTSKDENESNFHIFYLLCAGLKGRLGIDDSDTYKCLATKVPRRVQEDAEQFRLIREILSQIGVSDQVEREIFATMSAILNLGNIEMLDDPCDHSASTVKTESEKFVEIAAEQLGIDAVELNKALIADTIVSGKESIRRNLSTFKAVKSRDALCQAIYSAVFDHILKKINDTIETAVFDKSICLLDLAGFENFYEGNDLEQLCINYSNEKMFNLFTKSVLLSEEELLRKEGLQLPNIDYRCNNALIETFEGESGLFNLLKDYTNMGTTKTEDFTNSIHGKFSKRGVLKPSKATYKSLTRPRDAEGFVVQHYAEPVCYNTKNFLEKNIIYIREPFRKLLRTSKNSLVRETVSCVFTSQKSLTAQLTDELSGLLTELKKSESAYINCIKPNSKNAAFVFDGGMVAKQLSNCGLNAVLDLMTNGFPRRISYTDLKNSCMEYLPAQMKELEAKAFCRTLLGNQGIAEDAMHYGKTTLFLKDGVLPQIDELDKLSPSSRQKLLHNFVRQLSIGRFRKCVYAIICTMRLQKAIKRRRVALSKWRGLVLAALFIVRLKKPLLCRQALESQDLNDSSTSSSSSEMITQILKIPSTSQGVNEMSSTSKEVEEVSSASHGVEEVSSASHGVEEVSSASHGVEEVSSASHGVEEVSSASHGVEARHVKRVTWKLPEPVQEAQQTAALKKQEAEKTLALKKKALKQIKSFEDWRDTNVEHLIIKDKIGKRTRVNFCLFTTSFTSVNFFDD